MKTRTLYWTYTDSLGLCCLVSKSKGEGLLKSYGGHHQTELDDLLKDDEFDSYHPDQYLNVQNQFYSTNVFTSKEDAMKALYIVNKYYNCSERKELTTDEFFNLLSK